jgi:hypothetical protein
VPFYWNYVWYDCLSYEQHWLPGLVARAQAARAGGPGTGLRAIQVHWQCQWPPSPLASFSREETEAFVSYARSRVGEVHGDRMLEWCSSPEYGFK